MTNIKHLFILPLFLLLSTNTLYSQTTISDSVLTTTIWDLAGSPYTVTDLIVIVDSVTLTIEPGVTILFNTTTSLKLEGRLIAIGTPESRIVFTSSSTSPLMGDWNGIRVVGTTDPLGEGDQLTMKYVDGLYASTFVDLDLAYHGPYIFENCYFAHNTAVNLDGGMPYATFNRCTFEHNITGLDIFQLGGKVSHSNFIGNVNGAVNIPVVDTCYFFNNSGIALTPYGITTGCKIDNNHIGVSSMFNSANSSFVNNVITNNDIGIEIQTYFNGFITFTGNTICNNEVYNVKLLTANDADLSQNCWCTTDETAIGNSIFDGNDDGAYGFVTISPLGVGCPMNDLSVDEEATEIAANVKVFPNPFTNQFEVQIDNDENSKLTLFDMSGRVILQNSFSRTTNIQTQDLIGGVYIYQIISNNQLVSNGKLVKE